MRAWSSALASAYPGATRPITGATRTPIAAIPPITATPPMAIPPITMATMVAAAGDGSAADGSGAAGTATGTTPGSATATTMASTATATCTVTSTGANPPRVLYSYEDPAPISFGAGFFYVPPISRDADRKRI